MGKVQELKHAAKLQEWSTRVAECRSSGATVKAWCEGQGIALKTYYSWDRQIVREAAMQYALPESTQNGMIMRIDPETMLDGDYGVAGSGITIRHGESVITFPDGSNVEAIAGLVRKWLRHP